MDTVQEVSGAEFGDARLSRRFEKIVARLEEEPSRPFPQAMLSSGETEAFYRFLDNDRVDPNSMIAPHVALSVQRLADSQTVIVIHDSTEVYPASASAEGGFPKLSNGYGYLSHVSLALAADGFLPQGVVKISVPAPLAEGAADQSWRKRWHAPDKLSRRWLDHAAATEEMFGDQTVIHVMDSEGDSYEILDELSAADSMFVIRLKYDRRVAGDQVVSDELGSSTYHATREVELGVRKARRGKGKKRRPDAEKKHPPRSARKARLQLRAVANVRVQRPDDLPSSLQKELVLNVVHVTEAKPPKDEAPIDWRIITPLPVETCEQVERIVDIYRRRWLIEEFFKALKTGCGLNHRLPQTLHTAANGFALLSLFAWQLLLLRQLERTAPTAAASEFLTKPALAQLRALLPKSDKLPPNPRIRQILAAFARLGGHQKSNGPPGWQVLGRGYFTFLRAVDDTPWMAWVAARSQAEW